MEKPKGYDEAQAFGEFETLKAGGYKCLIREVVCEETTSGKKYLKIGFDIAEGEFKDFYQKKFSNDNRPEPKWSGIWVVFIEGFNEGTTNPKFKGLITSVEAANNGFKFDFDEQKLVNKKLGLVFREEEFLASDGQTKVAVKPFFAISYDKAEEAKIPNTKKLQTKGDSFEDFLGTVDDNADDLPF